MAYATYKKKRIQASRNKRNPKRRLDSTVWGGRIGKKENVY